MKTSLNFIKKIRGATVALMAGTFLLMSGQALAYPDAAQAGPAPVLTPGPISNLTSANLISKRDKLGEFYDQPSFSFNDAVGFQSTGSTNTIQVSKNSVVGALCQKGQLATDGIGKLLSCESGRFAEANGSAQDTASERSIFNNAKAINGIIFTSSFRFPENALVRVDLLGGGVPDFFNLNVRKGDLLYIRGYDHNRIMFKYINGRYIGRTSYERTYTMNRFNSQARISILDLPSLTYNPYRAALGLTLR